MSRRREIVPPDQYWRVLQELSDEDDNLDDECSSDCEKEENIQYSDHDSDSECEYRPDMVEEVASEEENATEQGESECFIKNIYKTKIVRGKNVKEVIEVHKWAKKPIRSKFARTAKKNILRKVLPSPKNCDDVKDEISSWNKIINTNMIDLIVCYTNLHIKKREENGDFRQISKRDVKETNRAELLAVIGILYLLGSKKMSKVNLAEAWARDGTGIEILQGVMGVNRFRFLLTCIRFDDKSTREARKKTDKLAPIREFFDSFIVNCNHFYCAGEQLTIDEKLEAYRGRCSFVQYIPNKPAKYGIKIFALVDSRSYYTLNLEIYCGRQPEGPYEVSNAAMDVVDRLIEKYKNSNRNLTTDNWYTSVPLAKSLLANGITLVGTMKSNKKEIPSEFLPSKTRNIGTSLFGFQKDLTLVSYVSRKNKCVILISTSHDDDKIDPETQKPDIILDYNRNKGGVDTVDQLCNTYNVARKTRRWPFAVFFSLLNIGGINAFVILSQMQPESPPQPRRFFLKNLSTSLI